MRSRDICAPVVVLLILGAGMAMSEDQDDLTRRSRRTPIVAVVERVSPAVVNISTEKVVPIRSMSLFDQLFPELGLGPSRYQKRTSLGSGVFVDPDGYILTNAHVVRRASQIIVTTLDGREIKAQLIGQDANADLSVLRVEEEGPYPYVEFGRSEDLMVGETVVAVGNPFGLQHTVTDGIVSALEREVSLPRGRTFPALIQTTAAINPGNSGGPLVNINGELVAINMAIQAGAENISFAIPVRRAKRVFNEFVYGVVSLEEILGLEVRNLTRQVAAYYGLDEAYGVVVTSVEDDSDGRKGGIRRGDVLRRIDGRNVRNAGEYYDLLDRHETDDLKLVYLDQDTRKEKEISVELLKVRKKKLGEIAGPWMGLTVRSIDNETARRWGLELDDGVIVEGVELESAAAEVGIHRGDLIMDMGRHPISSISDFQRAARDYDKEPPSVEIRVMRPGHRPVIVILQRRKMRI